MDIYLGVHLLGYKAHAYLLLQNGIKLFSKVVAPFYTHISVQVFLFLYIFTKLY